MANPLNTYFYNQSILKYTTAVAFVLSDLKVFSEGRLVRLPISYMGGLRDQDKVTKSAGVGLSSTLKMTEFNIPQEAVLNRNLKVSYPDGSVEKNKLPLELTYEFKIRFKKFNDMLQAVEQLLFQCYPHLTFSYNNERGITENLVLSISQYQYEDQWEGNGEEASFYHLTFGFTLSGCNLYGHDLTKTNEPYGVIKQVSIDLTTYTDLVTYPPIEWFKTYDSSEAVERVKADAPRVGEEGAYVFNANQIPELEVVASGEWTKGEYQ